MSFKLQDSRRKKQYEI